MEHRGLTKTGYFLLIGIIIGWGTSWPFLKIALSEIPPWSFRGLIAPAAVIFIFSFGYLSRLRMSVPRKYWLQLIVVSLFNIFLWHIFSAWGIKLLGSGQASIIAYTMPVWAVVFSIFLNNEKPNIQRITGLCVGITGLLVLAFGKSGIFTKAPLGTIIMLIAAISWGIGTALQKGINWKIPTITLAGWQLLLGGFPITIIAIFLEADQWPSIIQNISLNAILSTILILIYPIIFCWFAWFRIISEVPVSVSAVSIMIVPVIGVFSSHIILGEIFGIRELLGLLLVCSALALVLLPPLKQLMNAIKN